MGKRDFFEEEKMSKTIKLFTIVLAISVIVFIGIFTMYNKKLKEQADLRYREQVLIMFMVEQCHKKL